MNGSIYCRSGRRKYLTASERKAFIEVCTAQGELQRTFCLTLIHTGCRISEALELTRAQINFDDRAIFFRSLKKRSSIEYRCVPIPDDLNDDLQQLCEKLKSADRLWSWCRTTAWSRVKRSMLDAKIAGVQSSPKGLRHSFGVHAIQAGVPLNLVQRWLGHARVETTSIYTNVVGPEERAIAARMWW